MPGSRDRRRANETWALAVSLVWMLLAQIVCLAAWAAGLITRQAAIVNWMFVGVLPPALALWSAGQKTSDRR